MPKKSVNTNASVLRHFIFSITYGLLFVFLVANMVYSQRFPKIYYSLFDSNQSLVTFYKKAKNTPFFEAILPEVKNTFAANSKEIYQDERQAQELIGKLQNLLEQNPKSRDILYSLYLLYTKKGDTAKAETYFMKAHEIDPMIRK